MELCFKRSLFGLKIKVLADTLGLYLTKQKYS